MDSSIKLRRRGFRIYGFGGWFQTGFRSTEPSALGLSLLNPDSTLTPKPQLFAPDRLHFANSFTEDAH